MARSRGTDAEEPRRRPKDDDEKPRQKKRPTEDDEDEDEEDEGPIVPRKKRKSAKGPIRGVMITLGSIAGAVALLLLLYWVYSPMGTDSRLLCYVPPEATSLMGYDVADNAINPKMKEVHDVFINNYKRFKDPRFSTDCGVDEKDVERYLSGQASGDPKEEEKEEPQNRRGSFTIIRFKRDVDIDKFKNSFKGRFTMSEDSADGITFYRLYENANNARNPDISFYFPNDRTLIYTSTRKEMTEALKRQKNRVELEGPLRELADKVDGQYFTCSKVPSFVLRDNFSPRFGFTGNFVDKDLQAGNTRFMSTGSATWFASNGNDILFANGELYADRNMAKEARAQLNAGYYEARKAAFGEGGTAAGGEEVFFPKAAAAANPFGGDGGSKESKQAAQEAMTMFVKSYTVVRRGNFVAVSGMVNHEVFEKLWKGISQRFQLGGFGGGGFGMPGMPGMPMPPMPGPPGPMGPGPMGPPPGMR